MDSGGQASRDAEPLRGKDGKSVNWKVVTLAGASAIALSAVPMVLHATGTSEAEEVFSDEIPPDIVDDSMSFGEAFAAARDSMGPNQFFEWRGGVYSTCTVDEWEALHPSAPAEPVPDDGTPDDVVLGEDIETITVEDMAEPLDEEDEDVMVTLLGSDADSAEEDGAVGIDGHGVVMLDVDMVEEELVEPVPDGEVLPAEEQTGTLDIEEDIDPDVGIIVDDESGTLDDGDDSSAEFTNDIDF